MLAGDLATWAAAAVALFLGVRASCKEGVREDVGRKAARKMLAMPLGVMQHYVKPFEGLLVEPAMRGHYYEADDGFWFSLDFFKTTYSSKFLIDSSQSSLSLGAKDASTVAEVAGLCSVLEAQIDLMQRRKECDKENCSIALRCVAEIGAALQKIDWLPSLRNENLGCINPGRYDQ